MSWIVETTHKRGAKNSASPEHLPERSLKRAQSWAQLPGWDKSKLARAEAWLAATISPIKDLEATIALHFGKDLGLEKGAHLFLCCPDSSPVSRRIYEP
jgi:hypothetical protein